MSTLIMVAVSNPAEAGLAAFAVELARAFQHDLLLMHVVEMPESQSLSEGALPVLASRRQLGRMARQLANQNVKVRASVRVARNVADEIRRVAHEEGIHMVLCGWGTTAGVATGEFGPVVESLLQEPPADLAIVQPPKSGVKRILVSVRGGPYAGLATDIGSRLAEAGEAELTVLHVFHQKSVEDAILPDARQLDLLIMGAHGPVGAVPDRLNFARIRSQVKGGMMVVRTRQAVSPWVTQPPAWTPATVDKWFAENTFDSQEFADLDRLLEIKRGLGVTISLVLPALNEAETIGRVIQVMQDTLCSGVPLLDEIVVIDSMSTDGTPEIARSAGVPVYSHPEILPQYGTHRGKGEALWKSLHVVKGDLIVWLDTDIKNPEPHLVYGLIGPLLHHPQLKYVKGYYSRPVRMGDNLYESGGGRVTELTARPLLNLFFPELSGFIQPLSGQYAGWRHAMERMPFFTGYGVETGLLVDLLAGYGLPAMGQVNLGRLVHRNSPLHHLSTMSSAILQVIVKRLEDWRRLQPLAAVHKKLKLVRLEDGHLSLDVREIAEAERPPMTTVPEYLHGRAGIPAPPGPSTATGPMPIRQTG